MNTMDNRYKLVILFFYAVKRQPKYWPFFMLSWSLSLCNDTLERKAAFLYKLINRYCVTMKDWIYTKI